MQGPSRKHVKPGQLYFRTPKTMISKFKRPTAERIKQLEAAAAKSATPRPLGSSLKEQDPNLYALAKQRVLALQYGCGAKRFMEMCNAAGLDLRPEWERRLSGQMERTPGRERLFNMLRELERAGVRVTVAETETTFTLGQSVSEEAVMAIFKRHLPPTLKIIEVARKEGVPTSLIIVDNDSSTTSEHKS
jgi:hypothetical protein